MGWKSAQGVTKVPKQSLANCRVAVFLGKSWLEKWCRGWYSDLDIEYHCVKAHFSCPFLYSCKGSCQALSKAQTPNDAPGVKLTYSHDIFPTFGFSFRVSTLDP